MAVLNLDNYSATDATHLLSCRHVVGESSTEYYQRCIPLKSKNGKTKVVTFGRLFWKDTEHIKNVRYVPNYRILKIPEHS